MSQQDPEPEDRTQYGGQAVVEGVMMRSRHFFAVACRRLSTGSIVTRVEPIPIRISGFSWLNKPFLRGTLALVDAFGLGYRTLVYTANLQLADMSGDLSDQELVDRAIAAEGSTNTTDSKPPSSSRITAISGITIGATSVLALLFGYALFWILPAQLTDFVLFGHHRFGHGASLQHGVLGGASPGHYHAGYSLWANLVEGFVRIAVFLIYIAAVSRLKNVQRVFEYHGAEHKSINTFEANLPLDEEHALLASRIHPRCGTNFIFIVLITSIFVFSLIPRVVPANGFALYAGSHLLRLALLPVVAGISYEVLRFAGTHRTSQWAQAIIAPGLWTQRLTTREPNREQIEVALTALRAVIERERVALNQAANSSTAEAAARDDEVETLPATIA